MLQSVLLTASLALTSAQFVPTPCFSNAGCPTGSVCTAWRNASQCVSLNSGSTPCISYSSEPSASAFLPYSTFGAANRRTGVLFRVNLCGGQSSISLFPPADQFVLREDFGAGFSVLSADSTTSVPITYSSAPSLVNELYRARFMLLLDISASALAQYTTPGSDARQQLLAKINAVVGSPFNGDYLISRTQPVEFAVFCFAGDMRLQQLTEWSAYNEGAIALLSPPSAGNFNPSYLLTRPYPFVSDSTALFWAVPAAITVLQARSAAGRADDLYPAVFNNLVVVSDFLDTAGLRPAGAAAGQSATEAFKAAASAAAAGGIGFVVVPISNTGDAAVANAVATQNFLAQLPNSLLSSSSTWDEDVNELFSRSVGDYVSPDGFNANTLNMITFCPAYTAGESTAGGMELRAEVVSSLSPLPTPTGVSTALRYPSPPAGRCNPTQLAQRTPTPSLASCPTPSTPPPQLPVVSACTFFGGLSCGRTSATTSRGLRLECPCDYPALPTAFPTPTSEACAPSSAAAVAVAVTSSITPPGSSAGFAIIILVLLGLVGLVGVAARNTGALGSVDAGSSGGCFGWAQRGGGGGAAAPRQQQSSFENAVKPGVSTSNPLNQPGAAVQQSWQGPPPPGAAVQSW